MTNKVLVIVSSRKMLLSNTQIISPQGNCGKTLKPKQKNKHKNNSESQMLI